MSTAWKRALRAASVVALAAWPLTTVLARVDAAQAEVEDRAGNYYQEGRDHVEEAKWPEAIRAFDRVIALGGSMAPGAYYWKGYALSKQGRRQEALKVLAEMVQQYPDSRWKDDARALEVELRQSAGKPVSPEAEQDEELKIIALNSLIHMDEERALPMLEKILAGSSSPRMKEQALFVLVQTGSPRAREIVLDIARGHSSPDLQVTALEYIGMFGEPENLPFLQEIYESTSDRRIKQAILHSYMQNGDTERLIEIARNEPDDDVRRDALMALGQAGEGDELVRLYDRAGSVEDKKQILESLAMSGHPAKLMEVIRSSRESELRKTAVESLGMMDDPKVEPFLVELYQSDSDLEVRGAVLNALAWHGNPKPLIQIARGEKNRELRRQAVEALSMMDSKEATEFLMEILGE